MLNKLGTTQIGPTFGAELIAAGKQNGVALDLLNGVVIFGAGADQPSVAALFAQHDPTKTLPRSATGEQLAAALTALNLRTAWDAALAAGKPDDRLYWWGGYREGMPENNPKLLRVAKAANVTLSAVYDAALA